MPKRGEIYYVYPNLPTTGSENRSGRPAVIVSNNYNNVHSKVVQVVYLTTREKPPLPTHVKVFSTGIKSTAMCEQIANVDVSRLSSFVGRITKEEKAQIDQALKVALDLEDPNQENEPKDTCDESALLKIERDTYKKLYDDLIDRMLKS